MNMEPQIWICIGLIVYYSILQIVDDVIRISHKTNSNNRILESLRSQYKVTIRTFHAKRPYGFASFREIWLNEILLKSEKPLLFIFHHEYYHLKNNHKVWILFMRFIISLTPLTVYLVGLFYFIGIILLLAYLTEMLSKRFEKKANDYAIKMTSNGKDQEKKS